MLNFRKSLSSPKALVAASVIGTMVVGCGPAGEDSVSCAEGVIDDVGNLSMGILGSTVDDVGAPLAGVKVFIPGTAVEIMTDANGRFSIAADDLGGAGEVQIWAEKDGYPDKIQVVQIPDDHVADLLLVMKAYTGSDVVNADEGGTATDGQAYVTFQANSLAFADGTLATGPVEIAITTYASYRPEDMKAMPGTLDAIRPAQDQDGNPILDNAGNPTYEQVPIRTYGFVDVGMFQGGERLELVPGKPALVVLENIVEGEHNQDLVEQFNDENRDFLDGKYIDPTIPLWHFNYDTAMWDFVDGYSWSYTTGSKDGFLTLSAEVPEFSPANPDLPPVTCTNSTDVVEPLETCVCRSVMHKNDVEPVRGADMSLLSRALAYTYLIRSCSDGTSTRTLVNTTLVTWFERARTDQQGNFCGRAIIDPLTRRGSARVESTKTYWPGRLDFEDIQYKDVEGDGELDDNGDGKIDSENAIGYLGDTHTDLWTVVLNAIEQCVPNGTLNVKCINEPTNPVTGLQPE